MQRVGARALGALQQFLHGARAELFQRLAEGGQRRRGERGGRRVIEPQHRHIVRDAQARLMHCLHRRKREVVAPCENRRRSVGQAQRGADALAHGFVHLVGVGRRESPEVRLWDARLVQRVAEAAPAVARVEGLQRAEQPQKPPMPQPQEVLHALTRRAVVVRVHRRRLPLLRACADNHHRHAPTIQILQQRDMFRRRRYRQHAHELRREQLALDLVNLVVQPQRAQRERRERVQHTALDAAEVKVHRLARAAAQPQRHEGERALQQVRGEVLGDDRTHAPLARHDAFARQPLQRAAHRQRANAQLLRQRAFGRQHIARLPVARRDLPLDPLAHLHIARRLRIEAHNPISPTTLWLYGSQPIIPHLNGRARLPLRDVQRVAKRAQNLRKGQWRVHPEGIIGRQACNASQNPNIALRATGKIQPCERRNSACGN